MSLEFSTRRLAMQIGCMLLCENANALPLNDDIFYFHNADDMARSRCSGD